MDNKADSQPLQLVPLQKQLQRLLLFSTLKLLRVIERRFRSVLNEALTMIRCLIQVGITHWSLKIESLSGPPAT